MQGWVYLLECQDGSLYCGWTYNLIKRFRTHVSGKGSKYVKAHGAKAIVWSQLCESKSAAMKLENKIKQFSRQEKLKLVKEQSIRGINE